MRSSSSSIVTICRPVSIVYPRSDRVGLSGVEGRHARVVWRRTPGGPEGSKTEAQDQANREAIQTGTTSPPVDVGTTGNTAGFVPQSSPTSPEKSTVERGEK